MPEHEENIDQIIREKLHRASIEPTDRVWKNVSKSVVKSTRKRKGLIILGVTIAVATLAASIIFNGEQKTEQPKKKEPVMTVEPSSPIEPELPEETKPTSIVQDEADNLPIRKELHIKKTVEEALPTKTKPQAENKRPEPQVITREKQIVRRKTDTVRTETIKVTVTKTVIKSDTVVVNRRIKAE